MKCPHCRQNIDVQLIKAPADAQPSQPSRSSAPASDDLGELLESIDEGELDEAAAKFVTDTKDRFRQYGKRTKMSEKQMAWLKRIAGGENRRDDWN